MVSHRPRLAAGALVAASLLITAACSGNDDAASPSTTVQATTTAAPATSAPPTTAPETTNAPTTVAPPTTAEPTTIPTTAPPETTSPGPTTTTLPDGVPPRVTFPDDEDKQAVVDAFYAYSDAFLAAAAEPSDAALRERLRATLAEPLRTRVDAALDQLVEQGQYVAQNNEIPTFTEIFPPTVLVVDSTASFDACAVDANIVLEEGAGAGGEDLVVDDDVLASALTYQLDRLDGQWLVSDLERFGVWEGEQECGD